MIILNVLHKAVLFFAALLVTAWPCMGQDGFIRRQVVFLADSIGNRYPASGGDRLAQDHIARYFDSCGMESREQAFVIVEKVWSDGSLQLVKDQEIIDFDHGTGFSVSSRSASDTLTSEYVLVRGNLPDSLRHLMRDKVVICLQDEDNKPRITSIQDIADSGARAVIYVNPPGLKIKPLVSKGNRNPYPFRIPVLHINYDLFPVFLPQAIKDCFEDIVYEVPSTYKIRIATTRHEKTLSSANIIGIKKGSSKKTVIIGAHYDTLAPDPDSGKPRTGANDNASGVATLLALAKKMSCVHTNHTILFVAFGAEEKGCLGSMDFVSRMPFQKEDVTEMINLDMLGRMNQNILYYKQFNNTQINPADIKPTGLVLTDYDYGLSDHSSFADAGIPATYFHTGEDPMMHTSSDTSDRLNYQGMESILDFVSEYVMSLDSAPRKALRTDSGEGRSRRMSCRGSGGGRRACQDRNRPSGPPGP
ncbi:MAG: M20/M25/M40 family metallo-hydrolase [Bacteroidales bacterium]|nr:M20/M25/M40 family metallo-hydrolase [Bacteroidales bacterium]